MATAEHDLYTRHFIDFGSGEIYFILKRSSQRKSLGITVTRELKVIVSVPADCTDDRAIEFVQRRSHWIARQFEYFRRFRPLPTPRRYISGETHLYLGKQYRLKVIEADRDEVKLIRGILQVFIRGPKETARVKRLFERWFDEHSKATIAKRLAICLNNARHQDLPEPKDIIFRKMHSRWGSCTKKGTIILNTKLGHVPVSCIDYVITHEICHLKYPNHSRVFYTLLEQLLPDWKERKRKLDSIII